MQLNYGLRSLCFGPLYCGVIAVGRKSGAADRGQGAADRAATVCNSLLAIGIGSNQGQGQGQVHASIML